MALKKGKLRQALLDALDDQELIALAYFLDGKIHNANSARICVLNKSAEALFRFLQKKLNYWSKDVDYKRVIQHIAQVKVFLKDSFIKNIEHPT